MKTFISYASNFKRTSGRIKEYLDQYGFNCFLAHEDIPPQTVWPAEIVRELERCDLFLPLLTPGFIESLYCQQETGFAFSRDDVEILPVYVSRAPMGMIANIQAVKFNRRKFESSCWRIVKHVGKMESLSRPVLDALIEWFGESGSYDIATERAKKILNEFDFTQRQVKTIRRYIKKNSQIYETKEARDSIFKFMDKYSRHFDDDYRDWYDSRRASRMHMRY
ncbi:MAG: toll/interleukin-1 receptor domain-containing protein [Deltaproteobacteria bacterium]|nr:toll/interleukin-1 receptor domain-containing protein [Deltaproteobacteria bacterium]